MLQQDTQVRSQREVAEATNDRETAADRDFLIGDVRVSHRSPNAEEHVARPSYLSRLRAPFDRQRVMRAELSTALNEGTPVTDRVVGATWRGLAQRDVRGSPESRLNPPLTHRNQPP